MVEALSRENVVSVFVCGGIVLTKWPIHINLLAFLRSSFIGFAHHSCLIFSFPLFSGHLTPRTLLWYLISAALLSVSSFLFHTVSPVSTWI